MNPLLERLSWVAGIIAGGVAVAVFLLDLTNAESSDPGQESLLSKRLPNVFAELSPGASTDKMRSLLGVPHAQGASLSGVKYINRGLFELYGKLAGKEEEAQEAIGEMMQERSKERQYSYRFDDALVQIRSADGETISELAVMTRD